MSETPRERAIVASATHPGLDGALHFEINTLQIDAAGPAGIPA